jgi:signal transduction histidine kinase
VAEAKEDERCPTRVRVVLAISSVAAEIDETRLVGLERELVPSETLAQNIQNPLGILEVRERHHGVVGDEQRLTQVLLNLVGNAIKFTDRGEVHVTAKAVNGHFAVTVMDTGPGIPEAEQTRIFEQFHQVDSSLTRAKGGTGLGLAIAKQIVEMHGGRIWVDARQRCKLPDGASYARRASQERPLTRSYSPIEK